MKNLKLLLATTAMLSMGAMVANATDPVSPVGTLSGESVPVQAKAEIIHARSLSATPLDFGKIVVPTSGDDMRDEVGVIIDRDGNETMAGDFPGYILQKGAKGVVTGATCDELNWTEDLIGDERNYTLDMTTKPAGVAVASVEHMNCSTDDGKATFYGLFNVVSIEAPVPAGEYSGSFTVTVIEGAYPVDDGE